MKPTDFEQTVQYQFDCFVRKVLIRAAMNYHNEYARRLKHEATFSDLSDIDLSELTSTDTYNLDSCTFSVLGMDVIVTDAILAKALQILPEKKQNIVLLFYFLDMSDAEIAETLHLVRSTIYRHRTNALLLLKKELENIRDE